MEEKLSQIFKAYDVRGIYPEQISEEVVFKIALGICDFLTPQKMALGRDVRISSPSLYKSAKQAFLSKGVEVWDIGEITTDQLYFATSYYNLDGGIIITASHNPKEYNGIKFVREKSIPISGDTGLLEIKELAKKTQPGKTTGRVRKVNILKDYLNFLVGLVNFEKIKNFKIVANPNFGVQGEILDAFVKEFNLPFEIIPLNYKKNGNFPKGRPDPLIPENRKETSILVKENKADLGVAWDADADRCFFFDEKGEFIYPYFITCLLAEYFLSSSPGAKIIHDTRLYWGIKKTVEKYGGQFILNKAGHAFLKDALRKHQAVFGAETSAHFYFKDFYWCDNGFLPLLLILKILSQKGISLSKAIVGFRKKYFLSDEINFEGENQEKIKSLLSKIEEEYKEGKFNYIDGISCEFSNWRFNLRPSNTEPLVRLNIEANSQELLEEKIFELTKKIKEILGS